MTIPHIAIISGLLLAGNNPNTLEGVVGRKSANEPRREGYFLELVYESRYRPAWIWDRGRNKRLWAMRLQRSHHASPDDRLRDKIAIGIQDWVTIFLFAFALIVIPSTLALLTSFYTPRIGLSCRSMTFLTYMICQLCLILLWIWNIQSAVLLDDLSPYMPVTRIPWRSPPPPGASPRSAWYPWLWYPLVIIIISCATFTAIGGTMMQIIGVYRNCLCDIPITTWHHRNNELFLISTNAADDINRAVTVWTGTGITAVAFLGLVSFFGWWYQKRLRFHFRKLILDIDQRPVVMQMQPLGVNGGVGTSGFNQGSGGAAVANTYMQGGGNVNQAVGGGP